MPHLTGPAWENAMDMTPAEFAAAGAAFVNQRPPPVDSPPSGRLASGLTG